MLANTRSRERAIFAACLLVILTAFLVMLTRSDRDQLGALRQEEGSLAAPPSDSLFTDGFGAPSAPAPAEVDSPPNDAPAGDDTPGEDPSDPRTPGAPEAPVVPPDDPDDGGLLGFLPDLPILPPLPPPPGRPNWLPTLVLPR